MCWPHCQLHTNTQFATYVYIYMLEMDSIVYLHVHVGVNLIHSADSDGSVPYGLALPVLAVNILTVATIS